MSLPRVTLERSVAPRLSAVDWMVVGLIAAVSTAWATYLVVGLLVVGLGAP